MLKVILIRKTPMDRLKIYARREKNSLNENQFESLTTAKNKCYPLDNEDVNGIQQNHLQLAKLWTTEGIGEKVRQTFPCEASRLPMKLSGSEYFGNLTNQNFDSLLSTFLANVKDGSDLCGKSETNLLNLEIELSKSYSIALRHLNYLMNEKEVHEAINKINGTIE